MRHYAGFPQIGSHISIVAQKAISCGLHPRFIVQSMLKLLFYSDLLSQSHYTLVSEDKLVNKHLVHYADVFM